MDNLAAPEPEASAHRERPFAVVSSAATHVGYIRRVNEDSYLALDPVYLVADGMGGHNAGEVASAIVIDEFMPLAGMRAVELDEVADAMVRAYERIASIVDGSPRNPGTTVAMVTLTWHEGEPHWLVMNLGDSRVYMVHDGEFSQVSVDHSVVQELVDRGDITALEARTHPYRNMITRALGVGPDTRPDFWLLPVISGDRFLICSDGVSGEVDDATIKDILDHSGPEADTASALVEAALNNGGRDNATAVVIDVVERGHAGHIGEGMFTTVDLALLPRA